MKASRWFALALTVGFLLSAMASCSDGESVVTTEPVIKTEPPQPIWLPVKDPDAPPLGAPQVMCDTGDSASTPEAGATSLVIIVDPKAGE